jgi:hypothetical protein
MMKTAVTVLSVVPMRKEPAHRSEMVSQLLFGEYVEILEEEEYFTRVKCLYDNYEGWVQSNQLTPVDQVLTTDIYVGCWMGAVLINGENRNIPMCTPVYTDKEMYKVADKELRYSIGDDCLWKCSGKEINAYTLEQVYAKFLYTPYLWGGKSVFGIDCSGFVQQVFKLFGIKLLRDAYLQAGQGSVVSRLAEARLGDLAFFQNENGRVTHVGIILENQEIVHASGQVRIDLLDREGIVNRETGKRTHQLHSIKRYF